jgi:hypothetical protein
LSGFPFRSPDYRKIADVAVARFRTLCGRSFPESLTQRTYEVELVEQHIQQQILETCQMRWQMRRSEFTDAMRRQLKIMGDQLSAELRKFVEKSFAQNAQSHLTLDEVKLELILSHRSS